MSNGAEVPITQAAVQTLMLRVALIRAADMARNGQYAEAEKLVQDMVYGENTLPEALDLLAKMRAQQGKLTGAASLWRQAVQMDAGNKRYSASLKRAEAQSRQPLLKYSAYVAPMLALLLVVGLLAGMGILLLQLRPVESASTVATAAPDPATPTPDLVVAVQQALQTDAATSGLSINVEQVNDSIVLSGVVISEEQRSSVIEAARGVDGVALVDGGGLQIAPPLPLVETIENNLHAQPDLAALELEITQIGSNIRVSGSVPSASLKMQVEQIVRSTEGVELVDTTNLNVVPPVLVSQVEDALKQDVRTADLDLEIEQNAAGLRISGIVADNATRDSVVRIAHAVPGVDLVDSSDLLVQPEYTEYTVQPDDNLALLAWKFYGDQTKWPLIYVANQDVIVRDYILYAGMVLQIPVLEDH